MHPTLSRATGSYPNLNCTAEAVLHPYTPTVKMSSHRIEVVVRLSSTQNLIYDLTFHRLVIVSH